MRLPPRGVTLDVDLRRVIDGDTVVVMPKNSKREYHIRLIDCWAPETRTKDAVEKESGLAAKKYLTELLDDVYQLAVYIPFEKDAVNILEGIMTMGRVAGWLFTTDSPNKSVNEMMIDAGHATKVKS